jgi:zinc protease
MPVTLRVLAVLITALFVQSVFAGPKIQHWQTGNGARVFFVAAPELPMVDVQVVFDAGGARDGNKPGLALLTNTLLPEGAGDLNAEQISEQFDSLGAQFGNSSQRDMFLVTLRSLSEEKYLKPGLDLLATILQKPAFPQNAFERERNRLLIALEQRKQQPGSIASEAFYKALYGDHPYSQQPGGNMASVKALTIEDMRGFYQQYIVANNAVIAIVGDLDRKQAEQTAETIIGSLASGERASVIAPVSPLAKASEINIEHPSAQTHILVGQPGVKRGDPDHFALYVGNHILGGSGLVARLSNEIREKRGLSYSTYSYFNPMRSEGPYTLGLQTRNDTAQQALEVLRAELTKFVNEGPTQQELDEARQNITGGFPLRIASNSKILGYIGMIGFYGLPLDYLDTFNDKIGALTVASIRDAFKRRVDPAKMATVLVGGKAMAGHNMTGHQKLSQNHQ